MKQEGLIIKTNIYTNFELIIEATNMFDWLVNDTND